MTTTQESTSPHNPPHAAGKSLYYLQVIFGVAFILATLFTTFPPPSGVLPEKLPVVDENVIGYEASAPEDGIPTQIHPVLRIGILAGHTGGIYDDPGAVCPEALGSIREVDINSSVASSVKNMLNKEGYEVDILTEWDPLLDGLIALSFISIHTDSCTYVNPEATGFKTAPSSTNQLSSRLDSCLKDRYAQATGMSFHPGVTSDMTDYHAFYSISNQTPAAIIELGFMNLDHDRLLYNQEEMAQGITKGILCFLRNELISTPQPTPTP